MGASFFLVYSRRSSLSSVKLGLRVNDQRLASLPLYIVSVTSIGIVLFSAFLMYCVRISILLIRIELPDANSVVGLGKNALIIA